MKALSRLIPFAIPAMLPAESLILDWPVDPVTSPFWSAFVFYEEPGESLYFLGFTFENFYNAVINRDGTVETTVRTPFGIQAYPVGNQIFLETTDTGSYAYALLNAQTLAVDTAKQITGTSAYAFSLSYIPFIEAAAWNPDEVRIELTPSFGEPDVFFSLHSLDGTYLWGHQATVDVPPDNVFFFGDPDLNRYVGDWSTVDFLTGTLTHHEVTFNATSGAILDRIRLSFTPANSMSFNYFIRGGEDTFVLEQQDAGDFILTGPSAATALFNENGTLQWGVRLNDINSYLPIADFETAISTIESVPIVAEREDAFGLTSLVASVNVNTAQVNSAYTYQYDGEILYFSTSLPTPDGYLFVSSLTDALFNPLGSLMIFTDANLNVVRSLLFEQEPDGPEFSFGFVPFFSDDVFYTLLWPDGRVQIVFLNADYTDPCGLTTQVSVQRVPATLVAEAWNPSIMVDQDIQLSAFTPSITVSDWTPPADDFIMTVTEGCGGSVAPSNPWESVPADAFGFKETGIGLIDDANFPYIWNVNAGSYFFIDGSVSSGTGIFGFCFRDQGYWFWTRDDLGGWHYNYTDSTPGTPVWADWTP